jgi:hypothetical protein
MELHSLANYPTSFKGTVISPTKICLQFKDVQVKLRVNDLAEGLAKMPDGIIALPVRTDGAATLFPQGPARDKNVDTVAVGCQMPVLEELQFAMITAYISYGRHHAARYKQEYGRSFLDFLLHTQNMLSNAILELRDIKDHE